MESDSGGGFSKSKNMTSGRFRRQLFKVNCS